MVAYIGCNNPSDPNGTMIEQSALYSIETYCYDVDLNDNVLGIYIVECSTGFLLEQITGKCPWEYTSGWHLLGYIRLDYFPSWLAFAFIIESLYLYLESKLLDN